MAVFNPVIGFCDINYLRRSTTQEKGEVWQFSAPIFYLHTWLKQKFHPHLSLYHFFYSSCCRSVLLLLERYFIFCNCIIIFGLNISQSAILLLLSWIGWLQPCWLAVQFYFSLFTLFYDHLLLVYVQMMYRWCLYTL